MLRSFLVARSYQVPNLVAIFLRCALAMPLPEALEIVVWPEVIDWADDHLRLFLHALGLPRQGVNRRVLNLFVEDDFEGQALVGAG